MKTVLRFALAVLLPCLLLLAIRSRPQAQLQMVLVDREGHRTPVGPVPASTFAPRVSPDGREILFDTQNDSHLWIAKLAYVSAETGRLEVYVRPFPAGTPAVQVSRNGGGHPLRSPDQKELYFDNNNRMFAASIGAAATFTAATPRALPIQGFVQGPLRRQYDLTPDGKHFLMMFP